MTPPMVLQRTTRDDLHSFIAEQCLPRLREELRAKGDERRLRVTDLPLPVMERLAQALDAEGSGGKWVARVLTAVAAAEPWRATATKLIELRNALREPLLVFLPTGLRTAAEDSLDVATFTEIPIASRTAAFANELHQRLPSALRPHVDDALKFLRRERVLRSSDLEVEYLLTVLKNGSTPAAAGGAMFLFGLIPDFALFDGSDHRQRLARNQTVSATLAEVRRPLQERIGRLRIVPGTLQSSLFVFLRDRHSDEPVSWTALIACDAAHRPLAFECWKLLDTMTEQSLRLAVDPLELPTQTPDEVGGATPMKFWDLRQEKTLKVTFASFPSPPLVDAWKSFRIQLLELNDGQPTPVWTSNNFPKPKAKARTKKFTRQLKAADLETVPEGSYFVRLDALGQDGTNLTESQSRTDGQSPENESDLFLVLRGGDGAGSEDEPARTVRTTSFADAWCAIASKASDKTRDHEALPPRGELTGRWDQTAGASVRGDVLFTFENPGANGLSILLPGLLRRIEYESLEHPEHFGWYRLELADVRSLSDVEVKRRWTGATPTDPLTQAFVAARKAVFDAILAQHGLRAKQPGSDERRRGTVETVDLLALRPLVEAYARAYVSCARGSLADAQGQALRRLIGTFDVTELRWRASGGDPGRALLVGPLHPLRMLWHLQHAEVVERALQAWQNKYESAPSWPRLIDQLRRGLLPSNLPMVLFDEMGRGYVERELVTSHWSLYLPDRGPEGQRLDTAASRSSACRLLGVRKRYVEVTGLSARDLAARVIEYLEQHPYVDQLRINVFNPGDGQLVADTLRAVESARLLLRGTDGNAPSLRYAIQMFAAAEHVDETGEALDALLDPERQVADSDEFTLASGNHLLPKLLVARGTVDEFLKDPGVFAAHLTIFAEHFRARACLGDARTLRRGTFVAGLVQEPETRYIARPGGTGYEWVKGVRPQGSKDADPLERLLVETLDAVQAIEAADAEGAVPPNGTVPTLTLRLEAADQALIRQVHDTSDWVLTIDRNLGLDYFDSAGGAQETGYLLDFSPEFLQEDQARVMLTTRSTAELEQLIRPTLDQFGLALPEGGEVMVLETLRSLSGRFALRMQSGPALAAEVVGLLVARWALERVGLLQHRIVIPIDAHRAWFTADDNDPLAVVKQRRADLILIRLRGPEREVEMHIVEVKQRDELGHKDRARIYVQMREQAEHTIKRLRELFDPDLFITPRGDRLLRAKELANVLSFYLARALRYGLLDEVAAEGARSLIETLDSGYRLILKPVGVLYECKAKGYHVDEDEPGFPVHRIGGDLAARLLAEAMSAFTREPPDAALAAPPLKTPAAPSPTLVRELDALRLGLGADEVLPTPVPASVPPMRLAEAPPLTTPPVAADVAPNDLPVSAIITPEAIAKHPVAVPVVTGLQPLGVHGDGREVETPETVPLTTPPMLVETPSPVGVTAPPAVAVPDLGSVIMLGATERTQQYGILGRAGASKVAVDLNGCNTISLFGVQGFGKSYTMGVIAEMAVQSMAGINVLPSPLATVIFHYHKSDSYEPEFATALRGNAKLREVERLAQEYGAHPAGLRDMVLLVPEAKLAIRREEYPGTEVLPIKFASSELGADGWKFLMGAVGNDSLYVKQIVSIMQRARGKLTLAKLKSEIEDSDLTKGLRKLAETRVALAEDFIDDGAKLGDVLRPGRTVIVDLRDEWLERDDALGLFVVMMTIFGAVKHQGKVFNKLMVFDEAHKYITESELIGQVVGIIREMRHQATSVLIASQDPLSVPRAVIELTSLLILHRMSSPQWLKHLKSAIGALEGVTEGQVGALVQGEALVWTQRSTDPRYMQRPQKIQIRPRVTHHGGGTKTAVTGGTVR